MVGVGIEQAAKLAGGGFLAVVPRRRCGRVRAKEFAQRGAVSLCRRFGVAEHGKQRPDRLGTPGGVEPTGSQVVLAAARLVLTQ